MRDVEGVIQGHLTAKRMVNSSGNSFSKFKVILQFSPLCPLIFNVPGASDTSAFLEPHMAFSSSHHDPHPNYWFWFLLPWSSSVCSFVCFPTSLLFIRSFYPVAYAFWKPFTILLTALWSIVMFWSVLSLSLSLCVCVCCGTGDWILEIEYEGQVFHHWVTSPALDFIYLFLTQGLTR
jgi:multidrug transporter EmrE-like cation transporter